MAQQRQERKHIAGKQALPQPIPWQNTPSHTQLPLQDPPRGGTPHTGSTRTEACHKSVCVCVCWQQHETSGVFLSRTFSVRCVIAATRVLAKTAVYRRHGLHRNPCWGRNPRPPSTPGRIQPQDISSAEALDTRSGAVHPQTRRLMHSSHSVHHLLGTKEQISSGSSRLAEKGNGTSEGERPPAGSPSKTILMSNKGPHVYHKKENGWWNGDKSYYRQQVERLGFRYHQPKTNVPRRAPGQYRSRGQQ